MPKIPIYTIQFLDIPFNERDQQIDAERNLFLDFITKHVFEIALKNQPLFKAVNCDAEYFHDDRDYQNKVPKIINCFIKDEVLTLRAYTKKGIKTLKFWYRLYKEIHPENCENVRFSKESYQFKAEESLLHHYTSNNWIAFDNVKFNDKHYFENGKPANFESKLIGHIRTFLEDIGIDNAKFPFKIKLKQIPICHNTLTALKTNKNGAINKVTQLSFDIQFSTNYALPALFSLGRKKAYGNGVFIKKFTKIIGEV